MTGTEHLKGSVSHARRRRLTVQFHLSTLLLLTTCATSWTAALVYGWQLLRTEAEIQSLCPAERELSTAGARPADGSEAALLFVQH